MIQATSTSEWYFSGIVWVLLETVDVNGDIGTRFVIFKRRLDFII